jgi:flagellar basal body rod protein FlgG
MFGQLYTAASGLIAEERALQITTNNLANARTPAFAPDRAVFSTYLEQAAEGPAGVGAPAPRQVLLSGVWRSLDGGPLRNTGNPLDLALEGRGFFQVDTPAGERLTRAGNFTRDGAGQLVTGTGYPVLDANGQPILLPPGDELVVTPDGTLSLDGAFVAQLGVVDAPEGVLVRDGNSLWRTADPAAELVPAEARVLQATLEESGVQVTGELARMISGQRLFEMQQRLVDVTANTIARQALELSGEK